MLQDIFVISHSPSGMETGKSKSEERSQLLTDPVVTGIAYEINKANKQLNQHRLQVLHQLSLWAAACCSAPASIVMIPCQAMFTTARALLPACRC